MALTPVADALAGILAGASPIREQETVPLDRAEGRTLAADVAALRTQPPFPASAMDGFAVRAADVATVPARLALIGTSAAGHAFTGTVGPGQCVRIFTGAPVPAGADAILIQENARAEGNMVEALSPVTAGRFVRQAGLDFREGEVLLRAGRRLGPSAVALAAAMGHATLPVVRRPRVAILATGDELVRPGEPTGPDQIVASNTYAVAAIAERAGAEALDLGIARDDLPALTAAIDAARDAGADVLVTLGGASVGDHDLVQRALAARGWELGFWRIAMRPGKPLMHGRLGAMTVLGLPGNPVSSIVCSLIFLVPLVRALSGDPDAGAVATQPARLGVDLPANDERQDYLRARLTAGEDGTLVATPFPRQDSSMLRLMAEAEALVVRAPHAPAARAGDPCRIIRL
ncbi:gephyrin-like molybdotransferase Glp [Chelatococcus composti]|jgi:molybdopterin molybdotransferase|uniref:Molybdopterin molybdenumtransferase n=1 Tax=Chelatococcus composti TaxID=1743235 RepID=A0A841KAD8_9HYPH|nr:gephyrin-like molybdotransferase Glp [Chelatococcus composti]MBB6166986.1 molybdopterin molybdotransferase [Chelatococcus composti]MBS7737113.1 molybdopterin molybdotransferase MoeA [Chelatococcus composti]PZN45344.1 MAG: molybdopterin molybdenumtransferase MoeA [Pseudomonadota bacterium]GGG24315.1 molybdopterin molybdenumtransferase MoeA [Chelatococcus composti]